MCDEPGCNKVAKVCVVVADSEKTPSYWCFEHMKVELNG